MPKKTPQKKKNQKQKQIQTEEHTWVWMVFTIIALVVLAWLVARITQQGRFDRVNQKDLEEQQRIIDQFHEDVPALNPVIRQDINQSFFN